MIMDIMNRMETKNLRILRIFLKDCKDKYNIINSYELYNIVKNNIYNTINIFPNKYEIKFNYQNLEKKTDMKIITKNCGFYNKIVGEMIYENDNKKISVILQDSKNNIIKHVLVNNKLNGAKIDNITINKEDETNYSF